MRTSRQIVEIDEEKCDGCGQCVLACAEGAIQVIDSKARLVGDIYCDGLGACIGECPQGALTIVEREAEGFDEAAVEELQAPRPADRVTASSPGCPGAAPQSFHCPGTAALTLERPGSETEDGEVGHVRSELTHWPIKLRLLSPSAPFLKGADLVLLADCSAAAFPDLHRKLLRHRAVALSCPKFDDLQAHIDRLADILRVAQPSSLTVVHMEVPCCHGLVFAAEQAVRRAGNSVPVERMMISRTGEVCTNSAVAT